VWNLSEVSASGGCQLLGGSTYILIKKRHFVIVLRIIFIFIFFGVWSLTVLQEEFPTIISSTMSTWSWRNAERDERYHNAEDMRQARRRPVQ
jgi:hypothetical protein